MAFSPLALKEILGLNDVSALPVAGYVSRKNEYLSQSSIDELAFDESKKTTHLTWTCTMEETILNANSNPKSVDIVSEYWHMNRYVQEPWSQAKS